MATYRLKPKDDRVEAFKLAQRTRILIGDGEHYEEGNAGDYLVVRADGLHIWGEHEFEATYVPQTDALTHWSQMTPDLLSWKR